MKKRTLMTTLAAVAAAVAVVAAGPSSAGVSGGKLVYSGTDASDGMTDIFVANADGSGITNISHDLGVRKDEAPHWSPDGTWVVFVRNNSDGSSTIIRALSDGSGAVKVLRSKTSVQFADPNWSPNGKQIVFASNADGNFDLYRISIDGGIATQLTHTASPVQNLQPDWHPNGNSIVFSRSGVPGTLTGTSTGLYRIALDGSLSGAVRLTKGPRDVSPAWSADGSQIAFQSNRSGNNDVYILNVATGSVTQVTTSPAADLQPAWSPDSTSLVYVSRASGATELWAIDLSAASIAPRPRQLTFDKLTKSHPDWTAPAATPEPVPAAA